MPRELRLVPPHILDMALGVLAADEGLDGFAERVDRARAVIEDDVDKHYAVISCWRLSFSCGSRPLLPGELGVAPPLEFIPDDPDLGLKLVLPQRLVLQADWRWDRYSRKRWLRRRAAVAPRVGPSISLAGLDCAARA